MLIMAASSKTMIANQIYNIASIVGKITSMELGIGPIARLRTCCLYQLINQKKSWYDVLCFDDDALDEIMFWINSLESLNGQLIWKSPAVLRLVFSDASSTGFEGYIVEHGCDIAHRQSLDEETTVLHWY